MASTDARPVPIKNTAFRAYFGIFKSDGTLITGAAGLDSEVSKDGGTFADCTNEATEIATSSGIYYLDLTSTEMNADSVCVLVKSSTIGAVPVVLPLYPQESGDIKIDVQSYGGTAGTFASGRPEVNATHWAGTAMATPDTAGYPKVTIKSGTGTGEISLTSGTVKLTTNLKKNQALSNYHFLMTDSTNHAPATGLTVTATRAIDNGTFGSGTLSSVTEISNGIYRLDFGAGDLNGNVVTLRCTATGADDLLITFITEP